VTAVVETCPFCEADLRGYQIPESDRHLYGGRDRFSRVIGIYSRERDRTVKWMCPDCQGQWDR
jgi:hypothetical protein